MTGNSWSAAFSSLSGLRPVMIHCQEKKCYSLDTGSLDLEKWKELVVYVGIKDAVFTIWPHTPHYIFINV